MCRHFDAEPGSKSPMLALAPSEIDEPRKRRCGRDDAAAPEPETIIQQWRDLCGCANTVVISPAPAPALYGLGWLASVSQPTRSSYQHRRASIAMRWQVLERKCSSQMRCPGVAVDAGGVCAHYRD